MTIRQYNAKGPFVDLPRCGDGDAVPAAVQPRDRDRERGPSRLALARLRHAGPAQSPALGLGVLFGLLWLRLMPARRSLTTT